MPHPHDISVQTFRGHKVLQTLIRAYFSPAHSTGQRFVYTGDADGTARIYGTLQIFPEGRLCMMRTVLCVLLFSCFKRLKLWYSVTIDA